MADQSGYFTAEFFAFFQALSKNNNKEWFSANKERYEKVVQEPALRFIRDAGVRLQKISPYLVGEAKAFGGSLSRIYRDIRFSPDKSPYKTHVGIHFWHGKVVGEEHTPGVFMHLGTGESAVYTGVWQPDPPVLTKIRNRIVEEPDAWKKVVRSKIRIEGESLKRPPTGYDPNHPLIQDLRRKDFVGVRSLRDIEVTSPRFLDTFVEAAREMDPLNGFLAEAMGLPW
ncbi:MAG TPA: TIGR02453 family protein [Thermoplasmata archaeon]|nr:TIGR02453 family protein [Thermoplasmata archaeon]